MTVPSIGFGLPICHSKDNKNGCSLIPRVATIVLGLIALLVGLLVFSKANGLQAIGIAGGAVFIASGSLALFLGFCVKCVRESEPQHKKSAADHAVFMDSEVKSTSLHLADDSSSYKTYCLLTDFLNSSAPYDQALCERLAQEFQIFDLYQPIKEFLDGDVELSIPLYYRNRIRDDSFTFQVLKLIYLPSRDLLKLPVHEIENYNDDQKNILSLRLSCLQEISDDLEDTLGAFLRYRDEIFSKKVSDSLYCFFVTEQVIYLLENSSKINSELVKALFPYDPINQIFTTQHSSRILSDLPLEWLKTILPYVDGQLLWPIIQELRERLNCPSLTAEQVWQS